MSRVLIVDDDSKMRESVRALLEESGCQVAEARDGKEALKQLERNAFDLVITDIYMPEMNGLEMVKQVREKYPRTKLIVISGGGEIEARQALTQAFLLGADRVFTKPFSLKEVIHAVKALAE